MCAKVIFERRGEEMMRQESKRGCHVSEHLFADSLAQDCVFVKGLKLRACIVAVLLSP